MRILLSLIYVGGIIALIWFSAIVIKDIFKRKTTGAPTNEKSDKVNTNYFGE